MLRRLLNSKNHREETGESNMEIGSVVHEFADPNYGNKIYS